MMAPFCFASLDVLAFMFKRRSFVHLSFAADGGVCLLETAH